MYQLAISAKKQTGNGAESENSASRKCWYLKTAKCGNGNGELKA
jgi:hypothetical protein